jgi:hypothetical protein
MTHRIGSFAAVLLLLAAPSAFGQQPGTDYTLLMASGDGLRAQGMDYQLQQIDFFGRDGAHASAQVWRQDFQWVAGDGRRGSQGNGLTYLIDERHAVAGVSAAELAMVADGAAATWNRDSCAKSLRLKRGEWDGTDATVFDFLLEVGEFGDPFQADVVIAGFTPEMSALFSEDTIGFAVTFVFVDPTGTPTDIDGDGNMDTALSEIYLNPTMDWSIGGVDGDGTIDVETTLLHELGHSLGIGHLGAPPVGVMNPVYAGVRVDLAKIDHAALCAVTSLR